MKSRSAFLFTLLVAAIVCIATYAPLCVVMVSAFNSSPHAGAWESFTLRWFRELGSNEAALNAARTTVIVALASTVFSTVIGTAVAFGLRRRFRGQQVISSSLLIPIVVPDIVLAVALLLLFRQVRERFDWPQPGLFTLILAHVSFQISFVALVVRARLADFDVTLEEAARDLGATPWQTFKSVQLPLIWPGILGGALVALTLSLDDFVVSFFTTGPGATTLPIVIYSSVKRGITPTTHAMAALFIIASIGATVILTILQRRARPSA